MALTCAAKGRFELLGLMLQSERWAAMRREGFLAHCDAEAAKGVLFDEDTQLSALIGRPTTPLSKVVAAAIG